MAAYHRPATLEEALAIRAERAVTVLAGGTDVYPAKAARAGWGDMRQPDILDISAVPGLRGIAEDGDGWRIGALDHLDRPDPRRAAAAVRRPEARGARGRRRADPEPRHARRQHLHGLAGGRRRAQPAGARCERGAGEPCRAAASCPCAASSTAIATPRARPDELVTAILVPRPSGGGAQPFPQARRAQVSRHLHRHGGRRHRDRRGGRHRRRAHRRRRLLGRAAAPAGARGGARSGSRRRLRRTSLRRRISRRLRPSTTSAARPPIAGRRR